MKKSLYSLLTITTLFITSCSMQHKYFFHKPLSSAPPAKSISIKPNTTAENTEYFMKVQYELPAGTYYAKYENGGGYFYPFNKPFIGKGSMMNMTNYGGIFWRRSDSKPSDLYVKRGEGMDIIPFGGLTNYVKVNN